MRNIKEGAQLREEGINQAEQAANKYWREVAYDALLEVLKLHKFFTTDEVWEILNRKFPEVITHEKKAMGGVIRKAQRAGLCISTDRVQRSTRPECHRHPNLLWKSLL